MQNLVERKSTESFTTETVTDALESYDLGGVDCSVCGNTGYIIHREPGKLEFATAECSCMNTRRALRAIRNSGMADMLRKYTLENYQTPDETRKALKNAAIDYIQAPGGWFFIGGMTGSGKTHLCSAICGELIKRRQYVRYMLWRDDSTKLKGSITDPEAYKDQIQALKTVPVLYIDDFFKSRRVDGKVKVTDGDVNLAFEILNYRYNDRTLRTIISTELTLAEIMDIDEATGGRIYERSRGFVKAAPSENWRLKRGQQP